MSFSHNNNTLKFHVAQVMPFIFLIVIIEMHKDIHSLPTSVSYDQICIFVRNLGIYSVSRNEQSYLDSLDYFLANQHPSHRHQLSSIIRHMRKADWNGAKSSSLPHVLLLFKPEYCCVKHVPLVWLSFAQFLQLTIQVTIGVDLYTCLEQLLTFPFVNVLLHLYEKPETINILAEFRLQ